MSARDILPYLTPLAPRDCFEFTFDAGLSQELVCHLEYEAEDGDGWNEPHYQACATLVHAYVRDVDIYSILSAKKIERIESAALSHQVEEL